MKSRIASIMVVLILVVGGTVGVLTASGGPPGSAGITGSASVDQYCPSDDEGPGKGKKKSKGCDEDEGEGEDDGKGKGKGKGKDK